MARNRESARLSAVGASHLLFSPSEAHRSIDRFGVREVEIALQAAVDPYFAQTCSWIRDVDAFTSSRRSSPRPPFHAGGASRPLSLPVARSTDHRTTCTPSSIPVSCRGSSDLKVKVTGVYVRDFAPLGFYQDCSSRRLSFCEVEGWSPPTHLKGSSVWGFRGLRTTGTFDVDQPGALDRHQVTREQPFDFALCDRSPSTP